MRYEAWQVVVVAAGLIGVAASYSAVSGWWGADFMAFFLIVGLTMLAILAASNG
jgi:hypothetical protein